MLRMCSKDTHSLMVCLDQSHTLNTEEILRGHYAKHFRSLTTFLWVGQGSCILASFILAPIASKSKPVIHRSVLPKSLPLPIYLHPLPKIPKDLGHAMIGGCDLLACLWDWSQKNWLGIWVLIKWGRAFESTWTVCGNQLALKCWFWVWNLEVKALKVKAYYILYTQFNNGINICSRRGQAF